MSSLPTLCGASRKNIHTYICTYVHVHMHARRAKRRAKESALCRPELSRSHGSSSGSGGDISTYLPTYRAGARACVSQAPFHILLPSSSLSLSFSFPLSLSSSLSSPTRFSSFTSADTPHSNPARAQPRKIAATTLADRMHYQEIMISREINAQRSL